MPRSVAIPFGVAPNSGMSTGASVALVVKVSRRLLSIKQFVQFAAGCESSRFGPVSGFGAALNSHATIRDWGSLVSFLGRRFRTDSPSRKRRSIAAYDPDHSAPVTIEGGTRITPRRASSRSVPNFHDREKTVTAWRIAGLTGSPR